MVSVRSVGENTIEETDKQDGKAIEVVRFTPSADGKTLTVAMENKKTGNTWQFVAYKK